MKTIRFAVIAVFALLLLLPALFFNFTPDAVSDIDNRKLAPNPFETEGEFTDNFESYVNDRVGFRDKLIAGYTVLNDLVFGKMVHPSYSYGKLGHVFGGGLTTGNDFSDFHIAFADMVKSIQDYCESRNIPFVFVFNPAKPALYQDMIPAGVNYDRQWVDLFVAELDKREINYVDNTKTLADLMASGTEGFNKQYDANHWNEIGAFHGTQTVLERLKEKNPQVHLNDLSDFTYYEALKTSLPVSDFPIEEYVPILSANYGPANLGEIYDSEINLHPSYRGFGYFINEKRSEEGAPSALVFQGSYMNKSGYKFLRNSFSEYTYVHDYQNVIDFPYYCNIFQPDCVIFEVAEYTLTNSYFNYEAMKAIQYNPSLSATKNTRLPVNPSEENITVKEGKALSTITWHTDAKYKYVWLDADVAYDMKAVESGYEVTVKTENLPDLSNCLLYTTPEDLFDDESGNLLPSVTAENGALLLNEEALEPGFYIDPNTGERLFLPEYNYRGTSSFIDIDPTAPYYLATFHEGNGVTFAYNAILGAYYDKDGKYISGIYSSDEIQQGCYMFNGRRKLEVPKNAEFLRICIDDADRPLQVLLEVAHDPSDYSALMEKATGKIYAAAPLEDKIIVNLGDSIFGNTENFTSVSNYISVKTGALVYNCGFGSGRMAAYGSKWDPVSMAAVAEYIGQNDFTALKDAVEKGWSAMPGYFTNTLELLENQIDFAYVDAITISYGTNDYLQNEAVLDNPDDPYDITTVCGALRYSVSKIQQKYPSIQILVTTPVFRMFLDEETGEILSTSNETNLGSGTLKDYAEAIRKACVEMNVPCLDLQNISQFNLNTKSYYFNDDEGVHPNAAGRRQMAALIGNALIDMLY